jgi:hypothetical protein
METVCLTFKTPELDSTLRSVCELVLTHFTLPPYKLLCFFDDDNPAHLDKDIGSAYCGFHAPIIGSGVIWPGYVESLFLDWSGEFAFENTIYLNGRTTSSIPGTVITLAHELQHFVQFGFFRKVWRANTFIYNLLRDGPPTEIKAWDLPLEMDAMAVSKRVSELVLGEAVIKTYADAQIALGNDPGKWKFFATLSASHLTEPFLLAATKPWVVRYMPELKAIKQRDVDFLQDEWWR